MNQHSLDIGYLLTAYAEGTLSEEGRNWVEAQLALHPQLNEQLEEIRQIRNSLLGTIPVAPSNLDPRRREQVLAFARIQHATSKHVWKKYYAITAAAALVAGIGFFFGFPGKEFITPGEELVRQVAIADNDSISTQHGSQIINSGNQSSGQLKKVSEATKGIDDSKTGHVAFRLLESDNGKYGNNDPSNKVPSKQLDGEYDENDGRTINLLTESNKSPSDQEGVNKDRLEFSHGEKEKKEIGSERRLTPRDESIKDDELPITEQSMDKLVAQVPAAPSVSKDTTPVSQNAMPAIASNAPESSGTEKGQQSVSRIDLPINNNVFLKYNSYDVLSGKVNPKPVPGASKTSAPDTSENLFKTPRDTPSEPEKTPNVPNSEISNYQNNYSFTQHKLRSDETAQSIYELLSKRGEFWTTDKQVLQNTTNISGGSMDGESNLRLNSISKETPYHVQDLSVMQTVLIAARRHDLQVRLDNGKISLSVNNSPLDVTSLYGWEPAAFKDAFGTMPMQSIAKSPTLTFALNGDTSSFVQAQTSLEQGHMPDSGSIQPEQFINAMPQDYPKAEGNNTFELYAEAGPSPFAVGPSSVHTELVSLGVVTRSPAPNERRPLHMTIAIDCSGSMGRVGCLDRIQIALHSLIGRLQKDDQICLVKYSDTAQVILPPTPGDQYERINQSISSLHSEGATNGAEGLELAYQLAAEDNSQGTEHRVLFATDGATLSGPRTEELLDRIAGYQAKGISLIVVGCGSEDSQQKSLQKLADHAHGQHIFLGSDEQAKSLAEGSLLPEHLQILARDAKVQVTWNMERVSHARLIGYEQRRLANHDFRNDDVSAGQLTHDEQVTALFEVIVNENASGPLGEATIRCFDTRYQAIREQNFTLPGKILNSPISSRLQLCACAAQLAELLQHGWWSNVRCANWGSLHNILLSLPASPAEQTLQIMCEQAINIEQEH